MYVIVTRESGAGTTVTLKTLAGTTVATLNDANTFQALTEMEAASCEPDIRNKKFAGDISVSYSGYKPVVENKLFTGQALAALTYTPLAEQGIIVNLGGVILPYGTGATQWDMVLSTKVITAGADLDVTGKTAQVMYWY